MTVVGVPVKSDRLAGVEALFRSEYRRLVGIARLLVDDNAQAEEVVQDAFVALHRNWDRLREPGSAPSWLHAAVVNGARGRLRKRATARRHLRVADRDDVAGPEEAPGRGDARARVAAALRRLPERQQACIALRFYADLTETEIASTLGISVGSVKTHVHRGTAALTAALEDLR
jgi:RNA polymerase sigma-70 factor (sigma-E family)